MANRKCRLVLSFLVSVVVSRAEMIYTAVAFPGSPYGLNDPGTIVGTSLGGEQTIGLVETGDGSVTALSVPGSRNTFAYGVDNAGEIAGSFVDDTATYGFVDQDGAFVTIDLPNLSDVTVRGMNNAGAVVGYARDSTGRQVGFMSWIGTVSSIEVPESFSTLPYRVNSRGDVAGYWLDDQGHATGFFLRDGAYTMIQVPGASDTFVYGLNNHEELVGSFIDLAGTHGFLLNKDGEFTTLDAPDTPASSGTFARDINNAGDILIFGFGTGTFLAHASE